MTAHRIIKLTLVSLLFAGCYYDVEEELYQPTNCESMNMSYSMDIVPILSSNCYVCHGQGINLGSVTLEGYSNLLTYVNDGRLLGAIRHESGFSPMPQGAPQLLDCNIEKIESWVADGAPDN